MKSSPRALFSAAIALAIAAGPAHAVLERLGPINKASTVGGFPSWFQDKTGITLEFCDPKNTAELNGGWCVLIPPGISSPEVFPTSFSPEHFYYAATNLLNSGTMKARLILAMEAAFGSGSPVDGQQITFGRHRIRIDGLPISGDYRVITPYADITFPNQQAGGRIAETSDIGLGCSDFTCSLNSMIGPFLLPSPQPGDREVPPMPDLATAPPGTDPFYDLLVANGGTTAYPGTGKKYIADPGRIGPVTGSPLPPFTAYNLDGTSSQRNHNTFRIEVRAPGNGPVIFAAESENGFTVNGRLMDGPIPGIVDVSRANYKADSAGNATELDVFATGSPTVQSRMPTQPQPTPVMPALSYVEAACGGSLTTNAITGEVTVNPPPYTAPTGTEHPMARTGNNFWGQSQPGAAPPPWVCVKDSTSRNAAGQVAPSYYLSRVSDAVDITLADFDGAANGTLKVTAVSSDPTAVLTLAGFGPAPDATPGHSDGMGAGTGLKLAGNAATVTSLLAPPGRAQVVSSKGGMGLRPVDTNQGAAVTSGVPLAVNDSGTMNEDCSAAPATVCAAGQGYVHDLLANDTVLLNGQVMNLRNVVDNNLAIVTVDALAPGMGLASITDGRVTYTPNPNANGADSIAYTVTVNGKVSNQATLAINVTSVNDTPVAANSSTGAVVSKSNSLSLIAKATDPDGNGDIKNAVIGTWPAQLGTKPTPANGVISFTPTSTGNFNFTYQVKDTAGALSNTATGTVTVLGSEAITITKSRFTGGGNVGGAASARWVVTGTDTVLQGQTLTIVYNNGRLKAGSLTCNGTTTNPSCVIGTVVVDNLGNYSYDVTRPPGGAADPTDLNTWLLKPTQIKVFSTAPALGGSNTRAIDFQ